MHVVGQGLGSLLLIAQGYSSAVSSASHKVVIQGLGSLLLAAQGYSSAIPVPPVSTANKIVVQGARSKLFTTQGYGLRGSVAASHDVVIQGLGSPFLVTQGYGVPASVTVNVTVTPTSLIGYAGLGFPDAGNLDTTRDYDVLESIQSLLEATQAFDLVAIRSISEIGGLPADAIRLAIIEPGTESDDDRWDDEFEPGGIVNGTCFITIVTRDQDQQARDRMADRLKMVARNAVNRNSLARKTFPDFTRFRSWQSQPAKPPERRVRGTFTYQYLIEGFTSFSAND